MSDEKPKSTKLNSRWRKNAQRYGSERTVDVTRYPKQTDGKRRRETDSASELSFISRSHEATGWHRGARVRKVK